MDSGKFKKAIQKWRLDSVSFVRDNFNVEPTKKQEQLLEILPEYPNIAVKAGRRCGKTTFLAWCVLWFMTTHSHVKIVCTAPKEDQLKNQLLPEIENWLLKSSLLTKFFETTGEKVQLKESPKQHFAVMQTAAQKENVQGYNAKNMMVIVDEASAVDREIIEAIRGSLLGENSIWVMAGNPTRISGAFFDIWEDGYGDFHKFTIDSRECELTSNEQIAKMEEDHPPGTPKHDMYIKGVFPEATEDTFIPRRLVERGLDCDERRLEPIIHMGVDAARTGDNKTVCTSRMGPEVIDITEYDGTDMAEARKFVLKRMRKLRTEYAQQVSHPAGEIEVNIYVDSAGLGGALADEINHELQNDDYAIAIDINPGEKPYDDEEAEIYKNAGTAAWGKIRKRLQNNNINLPEHDELINQLTQREYDILASGKEKLQPKSKMDEKSPDHADSLAYAFYEKPIGKRTFINAGPLEIKNTQWS